MLAHRRYDRPSYQQLNNLKWEGEALERVAHIRVCEGEPSICNKGHHSAWQ